MKGITTADQVDGLMFDRIGDLVSHCKSSESLARLSDIGKHIIETGAIEGEALIAIRGLFELIDSMIPNYKKGGAND